MGSEMCIRDWCDDPVESAVQLPVSTDGVCAGGGVGDSLHA